MTKKENKSTIKNTLIISILTLIPLLVGGYFALKSYTDRPVQEVTHTKKPQENTNTEKVEVKKPNQIDFYHYKTFRDKANEKILVIFQKSLTDNHGQFKHYIKIGDEKKELDVFSNDEHGLTLTGNMKLESDYSIIIENQEKKDDIREQEFKIDDVSDRDLSEVTKEKFLEHEKLTHAILSAKGAIKVSELNIKDTEDLLHYTEDKLKTAKENNDTKNIERFETARTELLDEIDRLKVKQKSEEENLNKLFDDNKDLEKLFTDIFGELHHH